MQGKLHRDLDLALGDLPSFCCGTRNASKLELESIACCAAENAATILYSLNTCFHEAVPALDALIYLSAAAIHVIDCSSSKRHEVRLCTKPTRLCTLLM